MKFIAILSSVSLESALIRSQLNGIRRILLAGKTVYKGKLSGHSILLMTTGIGKVNSAHSATIVGEHFPVELVINCGVGGAYPGSGLGIGDIAIASKEIYGDEGVYDPSSWKGMREIGIPLLESGKKIYFNKLPFDRKLLKKTLSLVSGVNKGIRNVKVGAFLTLSSVSGTRERAVELEGRFNSICENMEGAAIAHVCALYKIPLLEIRGISNIVGIRDKRRWNLKIASENCQRFVMEVIKFL